jgi:Protein tyrosine and serine/threonine kinase/Leucine rich repeat
MSSQEVLAQLKSGQLRGIKRLDLSCGLTEFPREIFDLADSLEILNLSGNQLTSLPDDLPRLHKLRIIFCSDNLFTELPSVLGECKQLTMVGFKANQITRVPYASLAPTLKWLILTDNRIQNLPSSIGQCTQMQKLMLAGNQLRDLPLELAHCTRLELLRLSANQFSVLPSWLLTMPSLAWLAIAGNPLTESFQVARQASPVAEIDWRHIELGAKLGEGASGVIFKAKLRQVDASINEVAVKLFKNAVTSDGLPYNEMAACYVVGLHPNAVGMIGKISNHPNETMGLVMPLIGSNFVNLAQPPSLDSCTRDTYVQQMVLSLQELCSLALDVANVTKHLHVCGIMHGDLYAHNILHDRKGHGLLGDFGAASFLPIQDKDMSQALQRMEVRAFGILLGELLAICSKSVIDADKAIKSKLFALQRRCTQSHVAERPLFSEVVETLKRYIDIANSSS